MHSNKIPIEIVETIIEFKFGMCTYCNQLKHFDQINSIYKKKRYRSIFDDDFFFTRFNIFHNICNQCIKSL